LLKPERIGMVHAAPQLMLTQNLHCWPDSALCAHMPQLPAKSMVSYPTLLARL
jgi:hypothetical protein